MAELTTFKQPDDARNAGSDGIDCVLTIIDHEGREFRAEVGLFQEDNLPPSFWYKVTRTDTSQNEMSRETVLEDDVGLTFDNNSLPG